MSTIYRSKQKEKFEELMTVRLERFGNAFAKDILQNGRLMKDRYSSRSFNRESMVNFTSMFVQFNVPPHILTSMAAEFDTEVFSGLHWLFWGYKTEEEWESVWQKIHGKSLSGARIKL